eukprot:SAG22_NODE_743_length_7504_cov_4.816745_2_plen_232_part_00
MSAAVITDEPLTQAHALVDEDHAVHTALDPKLYGDDEVWNQQLFTGGSPAELLTLACEDASNPSVPRWWVEKLDSIPGSVPAADRENELRRKVFVEIEKKSKLLFATARAEERRVRPLMEQLEAESNGELVGMEFSLKEMPSTRRKLLLESSQSPKARLQDVMSSRMTDSLRYTILYATKNYCSQSKHLLKFLRDDKGFVANAVRNYWETGHAYDGLNCSFLTDTVENGGA